MMASFNADSGVAGLDLVNIVLAQKPKFSHHCILPNHESQMQNPLIGVVMGSQSDWPVMQHSHDILTRFDVAHECKVVSAHRTPDLLFEYAATAQERGLQAIIAGAGGAAHLPGMLASKTAVPVLGVPAPSRHLQGQDSLLSIVQMPKGVPVATFAIGDAGAVNAALFAIAMLAKHDDSLLSKLDDFRQEQRQRAMASELPDGH